MKESRGGRPEVDFVLTLDMAKELAMIERNEKGRQIRQYFIWAETKLRALAQPRPLFNDMPSARRQLADSLEKKAQYQHERAHFHFARQRQRDPSRRNVFRQS